MEIHRLKWQFSQDLSELLDIEIVFTLRRIVTAGRAKMDQEKPAGFQHAICVQKSLIRPAEMFDRIDAVDHVHAVRRQ